MFRGCDDDRIERGPEAIAGVVIGLRSVAAHGLDAIFAAGKIARIGVANGGHSSERWTAVLESLQKEVAAITYADPAYIDHAVGILCAENPGRGVVRWTGAERRGALEWMGSGRGAAWLARLLGVQEVPSSNLGGPTN